MTMKKWYSCESAWPVIRRLLVAIMIGVAAHEILVRFDQFQPTWFSCIGIPIILSAVHFTAFVCQQKGADTQQNTPEV